MEVQRLWGHQSGGTSRTRVKHLQEWLWEHREIEAAAEAEEEEGMSDPSGRERGIEERREDGEEGKDQTKW